MLQEGATALILGAQMSRAELCAFLLGRGANANIQDQQGRWEAHSSDQMTKYIHHLSHDTVTSLFKG